MSRSTRQLRGGGLGQILLLPPAAFAVHQLRYVLAYGGHAGAVLQRTGHSYLHSVTPWIMLAVALAAGCFLRALGRAFAGQRSVPRYTASLSFLWLACTASLFAIFACQELLEGFFATGHPAGLAAIFAFGGWWALPVAAAVGLVLAAVLHGALWVIAEVALWRRRRPAPRRRATLVVRRTTGSFSLLRAPLAGGWSGRGPPR